MKFIILCTLLDLNHFSNLQKAKRVCASCKGGLPSREKDGPAVEELHWVEIFLIWQSQHASFPDYIKSLKEGKPIPKGSRLKHLTPHSHPQDGLVRVEGWIYNAPILISWIQSPPLTIWSSEIITNMDHHITSSTQLAWNFGYCMANLTAMIVCTARSKQRSTAALLEHWVSIPCTIHSSLISLVQCRWKNMEGN